MPISDSQKLDLLWKKIGYGAAKTDTNANKKAPNEAITSPLIVRGDRVWKNSSEIPGTQPSANSSYVAVYNDSLGTTVECDEDTTSTARRTWKTNLTNWISTEFGSTYIVKVYVDDPSQSDAQTGGTQLFATGSGNDDEWYFDYAAGLLHFIGTNLPSQVTSGKKIYIAGARYIGDLGVGGQASQTFTTLTANNIVLSGGPLETQYGGTGLASFSNNGVLFAKSTSAFEFATGSSGQVFQIASNNTPTFGELDGGTF